MQTFYSTQKIRLGSASSGGGIFLCILEKRLTKTSGRRCIVGRRKTDPLKKISKKKAQGCYQLKW